MFIATSHGLRPAKIQIHEELGNLHPCLWGIKKGKTVRFITKKTRLKRKSRDIRDRMT